MTFYYWHSIISFSFLSFFFFFGFLRSTQFIITAIHKPSHSIAALCKSHLTQLFWESIVNKQRFQARISHEYLKIRFLLHRKRSVAVTNIVNYVSGKLPICYDNQVKFHEHYVGKGRYTFVTLPRIVTPYRDSVDGTRDRVTYQKLVTR